MSPDDAYSPGYADLKVVKAALSTVERFSGDRGRGEDAHVWLNTIEELADISHWSPGVCLRVARLRLSGPARVWLDGVSLTRTLDWGSFKRAFIDRFGERKDSLLARLANCKQLRDEPVQMYADRFRNLARRAGRGDDDALAHQFIKGLNPFLRKQVVLQRLTDLEEVIDYVTYVDEWDQDDGGFAPFRGRMDREAASTGNNRPLFVKRREFGPAGGPRAQEPTRPVLNPGAKPGYGPGAPARPMDDRTPKGNYQAVTGYTVPFRRNYPGAGPASREGPKGTVGGDPRGNMRPNMPSRLPRGPVRGDAKDIDSITQELANMKLMYERDTGKRAPGPPACRLCHDIGHFARECPFQPTANCLEGDEGPFEDEFYFSPELDSFAFEGEEEEEAFAAEKRERDFQVQAKPRKRVAFDPKDLKPAGQSWGSPPATANRRSSFDYKAAMGEAAGPKPAAAKRSPTPPAPARPKVIPPKDGARPLGTGPWAQQAREAPRAPTDPRRPAPNPATLAVTSSQTTATAPKPPARREATSPPVETKAEKLTKIASDYLKNKVVLDPVKHRDLSMQEISTTIAEKLLAQASPQPRKYVGPRARPGPPGPVQEKAREGTTKGAVEANVVDLTKCSDEWDAEVAAYELNGQATNEESEESDDDLPALIEQSDSEDEEETDTEEEEEVLRVTERPAKPTAAVGAPKPKLAGWPFAPKPVLQFTSLRTVSYIGDKSLETIIDSGASHSFINIATATALGLQKNIETAEIPFVNADGERSHTHGIIRGVLLTLGELEMKLDFYVTKGGKYDVLLGSDFLAPIGATIDYEKRALSFTLRPGRIGVIKVNFRGWGHDCPQVAAVEAALARQADCQHFFPFLSLPQGTGVEQEDGNEGRTKQADGGPGGEVQLAEEGGGDAAATPPLGSPPLSPRASSGELAPSMSEGASLGDGWDSGSLPDAGNWGDLDECTKLPRGPSSTSLSDTIPTEFEHQEALQWIEENEAWMLNMMPGELPIGNMVAVAAVLDNYRHIFAADDSQLTQTNLVEHHIEVLPNTKPIAQRPYRLSQKERQVVKDEVGKMLNAGIIRPSNSEWSSPVVLVPKKDGGIRFTTDFRQLNAVTKRDNQPLPRIDTVLDDLGKASWFSKIDLKSGYWGIRLDQESIPKTAFVTPDGLYEYLVCPMGLSNSPATFQRLMNTVFRGLIGKTVLVYLDDIIVFTDTFQGHLQALQEVFKLLDYANLKAHLKKTELCVREVLYLGHIVDQQGVRPDHAKVEAVKNFPIPRNKKEVRSFLGLCGYYRRFIPGFAKIAAPLTALTGEPKKGKEGVQAPAAARFSWGHKETLAFRHLKQMLMSPPVLRRPDFDQPFILYSDWSTVAIGAILAQKDPSVPKGEYVIAYASRKLSPAEQKYSATEGECLAAVWGIKHYRPFLWGTRFTLVTDHWALQWLHKYKDLNGRLTRWALKLQEYDFEIVYRKGTAHQNVDALTRMPEANAEDWEEEELEAHTMEELELEGLSMDQAPGIWAALWTPGGFDLPGLDHSLQWSPTGFSLPSFETLELEGNALEGSTANLNPTGETAQAIDPNNVVLHEGTEAQAAGEQPATLTFGHWWQLDPELGLPPLTQEASPGQGSPGTPSDGATTEAPPVALPMGTGQEDAPTGEPQATSGQAESREIVPANPVPRAPNSPWLDELLGPDGLFHLPPNFGYTFIISLEGNIAAGKTTILRRAESQLQACGYEVAYEPIHELPDLLQGFYREPKRFAVALQTAVCLKYHLLMREAPISPRIVVVERSPVSSLQVFAKNLLDQEILSVQDFSFLRWIFHAFGWYPDAMAYVKTPAEVCHHRLQNQQDRAAGPDTCLPLSYLQQLEYRHEQMLRYPPSKFTVTLDGQADVEANVKEIVSFVDGAVRMGVFGVNPTPVSRSPAPLTNWQDMPPPFGEACTIELEMQATPAPASKVLEKDYSDTSTDPDIDPIACQICSRQGNWAQMLLCDNPTCNKGYHMNCLVPPLFRIPADDWLCPSCKDKDGTTVSSESGPTEDQEKPTARLSLKGPDDVLQDKLVVSMLKERHGLPHEEICPPQGAEPSAWKRALRRARKRTKNFFIDQGNFYKVGTEQSDGKPRRVPPAAERIQLIREVHDNLAHFGVAKCAKMLSKRFYWYNMYRDVADYIKDCEVCRQRKASFITYPELQSIEPTTMFATVALDTLGAFPTTARGNKHLAVCVEYYSRWVEARALPDIKSGTLAKFFEEEVICRHGVPQVCITDNGGSFKLEFSQLLAKYNIQHKHSAPFHPQGNGLVERCNQWMLRALQKKAADDPSTWDEHVHTTLLAYRAAEQASVGYTPFYILYGRECVLPGQLPPPAKVCTAEPPREEEQEEGVAKIVMANMTKEAEHLPLVKENLLQAQVKQKRAYRKRRAIDPEVLAPVGSLVYLKRPRVKGKLGPTVEGPYKLVGYNDTKTTAYIQDNQADGPRTWAENVSRLAPFQSTTQLPAEQGIKEGGEPAKGAEGG